MAFFRLWLPRLGQFGHLGQLQGSTCTEHSYFDLEAP